MNQKRELKRRRDANSRLRWQFSIRTLCIVTTVVAAVVFWGLLPTSVVIVTSAEERTRIILEKNDVEFTGYASLGGARWEIAPHDLSKVKTLVLDDANANGYHVAISVCRRAHTSVYESR